jgi:hypothetical protein
MTTEENRRLAADLVGRPLTIEDLKGAVNRLLNFITAIADASESERKLRLKPFRTITTERRGGRPLGPSPADDAIRVEKMRDVYEQRYGKRYGDDAVLRRVMDEHCEKLELAEADRNKDREAQQRKTMTNRISMGRKARGISRKSRKVVSGRNQKGG